MIKINKGQTLWHTLLGPALEKARWKEDVTFESVLGYIRKSRPFCAI